MKFKLDENLGTRLQALFRRYGHEVETVIGEGLQGCADTRLFETCCAEQLCLVTLDLDFSDIYRFPPAKTNGIIVLRVPQNANQELLELLAVNVLETLKRMPIEKKLWVAEAGRIRIHDEND
jgi:predicted nuclease of predicted toxin-antitoxin system